MAAEVHGHEVIEMMLAASKPYTRDELRAAIIARFGADTRFFTCHADGLTADGLIDFLAERGKFIESGDSMAIDPEAVCQG